VYELSVSASEFIDSTGSVDNLLFPGIERVAGRADFEMQVVVGKGGARFEAIAATASNGEFFIGRVDVRLHGCRPQ
jgi:hypothetical protein